MKWIVLDSAPLGILTQPPRAVEVIACQQWLASRIAAGNRIVVPEIVNYELRRELIRAGKMASVSRLDAMYDDTTVTAVKIRSSAMMLAADLWAQVRRTGRTTADVHALDIDVILCAQIIDAGFDVKETIVATSNVKHISLFLPAAEWQNI